MQHVRQHEEAFAGMPDYMHRAVLREYLRTAAVRPLSEEALAVYMMPWIGEVGQPAFYRQIAQMDQVYTDEIEEQYERMDCPVTVLWGEEDGWLPVHQGISLADTLSDKSCIRVPGCGHLMQEDWPEAVVVAVLNTVTRA